MEYTWNLAISVPWGFHQPKKIWRDWVVGELHPLGKTWSYKLIQALDVSKISAIICAQHSSRHVDICWQPFMSLPNLMSKHQDWDSFVETSIFQSTGRSINKKRYISRWQAWFAHTSLQFLQRRHVRCTLDDRVCTGTRLRRVKKPWSNKLGDFTRQNGEFGAWIIKNSV